MHAFKRFLDVVRFLRSWLAYPFVVFYRRANHRLGTSGDVALLAIAGGSSLFFGTIIVAIVGSIYKVDTMLASLPFFVAGYLALGLLQQYRFWQIYRHWLF